ncbi:MAG: glycine cleavage system protein GcvH [Bdellovibrionales bacterium]|nr:glycine cleavage system protein GcvH [Bdellovibrionales bacterium]
MSVLDGLRYTKEHEWLRLENDTAVIGITDFAQQSLGDITFVELPSAGSNLIQGETFGVVESVKAVSDLYAPCSGEILEMNQALIDSPEWLNEDPYAKAWMLKVKVSEIKEGELLSPEDYQKFVEESGH